MIKLTDEQITQVRAWAAEGETLNGIQKRLKTDLGLSATYLETRLLIGDLAIELEEWKPKPPEEKPEPAPEDAGDPPEESSTLLDESGNPTGAGGSTSKVKVAVDQITRPGSMVSGKVTFSDGKSAAWQVDQFGRLGLVRDDPTYQPPTADLPEFQRQLDMELRKLGL